MSKNVNRRGFLKNSAVAAAATSLAASFEEHALLARQADTPAPPPKAASGGELPTGKLSRLTVSRLICGGNLFSGFAHSRDLIYVSPLLNRYFTDEKVFETLALCESNGINTAIMRVDEQILRIVANYRKRGGKIQWIAQVKPTEADPAGDIKTAVAAGAVGIYVHGGVCDTFVKDGKTDLLGKALEIGRAQGVLAALGGHDVATIIGCEKAGLQPDFYMKTLNSKNYWSAALEPRNDSVWEETPQQTIEFMRTVKKPWIAYKVLGAGAIHPKEGFRYAFENGADFVCVGMFDFQVADDVALARNTLAADLKRQRAWTA